MKNSISILVDFSLSFTTHKRLRLEPKCTIELSLAKAASDLLKFRFTVQIHSAAGDSSPSEERVDALACSVASASTSKTKKDEKCS